MPLTIIRADITTLQVDAIVNAANETLLGGGGVDGAIHRAAGPQLLEECRRLGGCKTGKAKITRGYRLPAKYVIHTVGPIWRSGNCNEAQLLRAAYWNSLCLAARYHCESVAFPLISSGAYGYPKQAALQIATETIGAFLEAHEMQVLLVVFDKEAFRLSVRQYREIEAFIDQTYVDAHTDHSRRLLEHNGTFTQSPMRSVPAPCSPVCAAPPQAAAPQPGMPGTAAPQPKKKKGPLARRKKPDAHQAVPDADRDLEEEPLFAAPYGAPMQQASPPLWQAPAAVQPQSLEHLLSQLDESFSQMLLRKIDERGMKDSECYKKANVDRKLFSKIRSDASYHPRKSTALAFAVALELSLPETQELLQRAGFALTHASKFDVIVEYFIRRGNYNIFEINEALFAFDQALLGG